MISRGQYKQIKSLSREELDAYLNQIYANGHSDGVTAMAQVTAQAIDRGLSKTPGIGKARHEAIVDNITLEMQKLSE